jgi:hypothetical protein
MIIRSWGRVCAAVLSLPQAGISGIKVTNAARTWASSRRKSLTAAAVARQEIGHLPDRIGGNRRAGVVDDEWRLVKASLDTLAGTAHAVSRARPAPEETP